MKKIHITTLGCSKNVVDSEVLSGQLQINEFQITEQPEDADVVIVNTCGFIQDSKEESIQAILEAVQLKEQDGQKKVYVAGCLSQRYRADLEKDIPEIDAIFGTEDYAAIIESLGKNHAAVDNLHRLRKLSTPGHFAYLKISEGCNHTCAFCAIPGIRGKHRSRTIESLVEEAELLAGLGVRELILISQDTSSYGKDIYGKQSVLKLLDKLNNINGLQWIRCLYWYPTNFPLEVLDMMAASSKLVPYIDMPIQHISENMLRLMRRGDTRQSLIGLFEKMRKQVPEIALRTTLILGHPGETKKDFDELYDFIGDVKFNRLGTFTYSDEEGTPAYELKDKVSAETAWKRQEKLMELQSSISFDLNQQLVGTEQNTLIDEYDRETNVAIGRTYRDAPEIDNEVILTGMNKQIKAGSFVKTQIDDASEFELYASHKQPVK